MPRSHLFAVRVWAQELEDGRFEWRGRVQYVPTGEVRYFREWPALPDILQQLLPDAHGKTGPGTRPDIDTAV